ncbi:hypothetical protein HF670_11845 [Acidithiobacillus thiooxidans]|uniref:hypothetical protein n=1 Tax=Acidithiobacillus thiooxidans TaxID=930 RepID=UPI001C07C801|nr:hypothetical protein [Acidithiobacillus thiooxidans]MBU2840238.1 hypothetical protein [Acidithiobacillus thiooxidans]
MKEQHDTDANSIASVLESILAVVDADMAHTFLSIADTRAAEQAIQYARDGNYKGYYYKLSYPLLKMQRGLLKHALPGKRDAQFIIEHQDFVVANFNEMIARREGRACCADKTRTIIRKLLRYYITGEEIVFDRDAEYTFNLTEKVFTEHAEIVDFFKSLQALYYGISDRYLAARLKMG